MQRWAEVADALEASSTRPTAEQVALANKLGVTLPESIPASVAAVHLQLHLTQELQLQRRYDYWTRRRRDQVSAERILRLQEVAEGASFPLPETFDEAVGLDAWFEAAFALLAARSLRELQPSRGDIVCRSRRETEYFEVSSIGDDGVVYLRGTGQRSYPDQLVLVTRAGSDDYEKNHMKAVNDRQHREKSVVGPNSAKLAEIEPFRVSQYVDAEAVRSFERALSDAEDEVPLQRVLEEHPELLSVIVPRNGGAWVIPRKSLGGQYIPDFLVAGMDSAGLRWTLVELESPTAPLYIQNGDFGAKLRHGITQINDWREYLQLNLGTARRPRSEKGLGLPGILPASPGLVVVGRSAAVTTENDLRRESTQTQQNIAIHTYDWLLRAVRTQHPMKWGALEMGDDRVDFGIPDWD
jgi:hypothetical protein